MSYSEKDFIVKILMNKIKILHRSKVAKGMFIVYDIICNVFLNITILVFVEIKLSFLKHTY